MARDLKRYKIYQKRYRDDRAAEALEDRLKTAPAMTFREIGEKMGISEAYATKLYNSAIEKMKRAKGVLNV